MDIYPKANRSERLWKQWGSSYWSPDGSDLCGGHQLCCNGLDGHSETDGSSKLGVRSKTNIERVDSRS